MSTFSKWLFVGLGWAIGGPIGGIIGYMIGRAFSSDDNADGQHSSRPGGHHGPYHNTGSQADVNIALMVLIAAVMKADGEVKRSELDFVKRFLLTNYGEKRGKEMLQVIKQMTEQEINVSEVCYQIKVNTDYNTRYHMIDFLFDLGGADGQFDTSETRVLHQISQHLGVAASDYRSIYERHVGRTYSNSSRYYSGSGSGYQSHSRSRASTAESYDKDPYRVLGIDSSATDDEVRKAYRRMAMKYHPDRVAGMSKEMQRNATEQMKEINRAYDVIKQRRDSLK